MKKTNFLFILLFATSAHTFSRTRSYSSFNVDLLEGIPVGKDRTKLGKYVIGVSPAYNRNMIILDFRDFMFMTPYPSALTSVGTTTIDNV